MLFRSSTYTVLIPVEKFDWKSRNQNNEETEHGKEYYARTVLAEDGLEGDHPQLIRQIGGGGSELVVMPADGDS